MLTVGTAIFGVALLQQAAPPYLDYIDEARLLARATVASVACGQIGYGVVPNGMPCMSMAFVLIFQSCVVAVTVAVERYVLTRVVLSNGAADKPRKAGKPQAFSPGVGLIRVVVRRFAPRKQRMPSAAPLSRARKRPRQRLRSPAVRNTVRCNALLGFVNY